MSLFYSYIRGYYTKQTLYVISLNPNEEILYRAEGGFKVFFRNVFFLGTISLGIIFWYSYPLFWTFIIVIGVAQILFYKKSIIIVYPNRIVYENKNIVGLGTERGEILYKDVFYVHFTPAEVDGGNLLITGMWAIFFPAQKNEISILFTDNVQRKMRSRGNLSEVQKACEIATDIIRREFNQHEFIR